MDIGFLVEFFVPIIAGICLGLGYMIKKFPMIESDYIPVINGVVGILLAFWVFGELTPEVLLKGMFSGLSATGLYEAFKNIVERSGFKKADEEEEFYKGD